MDSVLAPLIEEIDVLIKEGVTYATDSGFEMHCKVEIHSFCGDNKAIHELINMSVGFRGSDICRWCLNTGYNDIQYKLKLELFIAANNESFKKRKSKLLSLDIKEKNYAFPPDLVHDIFEGVVEKILPLIVKKICIKPDCIQKINISISEATWRDGKISQLKNPDLSIYGTA